MLKTLINLIYEINTGDIQADLKEIVTTIENTEIIWD